MSNTKVSMLEQEVLGLACRVDILRAKLKKARRRIAALESNSRHFVANADGTFTCEDCFSPELRKRLGDEDVQVWEEGSHGWTGPIRCAGCKLSIPVYVDGEGAS